MRKLNQGWGLDRVKHRPAGSAACSSVVFEKQSLREERLLSVRPAFAAAQAPKPFGLDQRELFPDKVSGCLDFRRSVPSQPPWFRPNSIQEKLRQSARFPTLNTIYFLAACDRKQASEKSWAAKISRLIVGGRSKEPVPVGKLGSLCNAAFSYAPTENPPRGW